MEASELLCRTILQVWYFTDFPYVCLVDDPWTVVPSLERVNGFYVLVTGVGETFNNILGCTILQRVAKIHQLLCVRNVGALVDRNAELLPESLPMEQLAIKRGHVDPRQFNRTRFGSDRRRHSCKSGGGADKEGFLDSHLHVEDIIFLLMRVADERIGDVDGDH